MTRVPWDQRVARMLVRPLAATPVRPNHITCLTLLLAVTGALLIAYGETSWGAGIFVLSRFLDHFDGELARLQGTSSKLGYYLDYAAGGGSYAVLFVALAAAYWDSLGIWSWVLGLAGAASAMISMVANLAIDRKTKDVAKGEAVGYPAFAGFELEDGTYLLAPVAWAGWLEPFFIAAGIGASAYCLWTLARALSLAGRSRPTSPSS